jgi:hypothetical protein
MVLCLFAQSGGLLNAIGSPGLTERLDLLSALLPEMLLEAFVILLGISMAEHHLGKYINCSSDETNSQILKLGKQLDRMQEQIEEITRHLS